MVVAICMGCNNLAADCGYDSFLEPGESADEYVKREEGTYNHNNGHFLCDGCYIKAGMPSSPSGWICP